MQSPYSVIAGLPPDIFVSHLNILTNSNGQENPLQLNNGRQRELFEVGFLNEQNEGAGIPFEKSMDEILNLNKYTCHICNIEVPKMYMKEHNSSNKHKTCNEIANIALERTRLQVQLDVAVSRRIEIIDTYFCEPCSIVVQSSAKEQHEHHKIHKISVKHDELLNDLLQIYLDRENVEVKSVIDELELLQQKIDLESLQEGSQSQNTETGLLEIVDSVEEIDIESVKEQICNILKSEFQNVVDEKRQSLINEVKEYVPRMKLEIARLKENFEDFIKERALNLNTLTSPSVEGQRNFNKRSLKKQKKKERLHNNCTELVTKEPGIPEDGNTLKTQVPPSTSQHQKENAVMFENNNNIIRFEKENATLSDNNHKTVIDLTPSSEEFAKNLNFDKTISKKVDEILTKYFDKSYSVDALNSCTVRKHYKKIKEPKKNKNELIKEQNVTKLDNISNIEQNLDEEPHGHIDQYQEQNNNITTHNMTTENKDEKDNNLERNNNDTKLNKNTKNKEQNNNNKPEQDRNVRKIMKSNYQGKKKVAEQQKKNTEEINKASNIEKSQAPGFNLLYYLKDTAWRCQTKPIHSVEALTDTIIQITAINGDKIKILVNNFHSFHAKGPNTFCKICEVANIRRPEWHIIEAEHRAKVMIPIHDKDGIRQLDDIWSHCILCNDLTKNIDFHLQSLLHRNKVRHCLVELGNNGTDSDDDCFTHEKSSDMRGHSRDKMPLQHVPKNNDKQRANIAALMLKNNLVMTSKNYLNCVICNVIVNYDSTSVEQHVKSFDHLNNFERVQNENWIIEIDTQNLYCIACDVNISTDEIVSHWNGRKHKKMLQELANKQGKVAEDGTEIVLPSISQNVKKLSNDKLDDSELICFVCNTILFCVDEHMDSFEHKKSYFTYLEANKLNEIEADTFYCIPCNTVITIDYLMSHCTSRKHRITLKNFLDHGSTENVNDNELSPIPSTSSDVTYIVAQTLDVNDKTMPLKVLYQFREMTDKNKILCTVCFEEVTYTRKEAVYHVSTLDHVVAFNLMMLWNKIKKRDDKYFCDICRLDMTYFSEITHVLGKQHASNLAKEPKGTVYEYDRTLVTHAYAMSHKVGNRTRPSSVISVTKPKKK